jgi:hypothetical protein
MTEQLQHQRDLLRGRPSLLALWAVPTGIVVAASLLYSNRSISLTVAGVLWTVATFWIGAGCALNALHCGRVHCVIDGVLFPLLGVAGVFRVLGVLTFSWNLYGVVFLAVLAASFVPEFVWRKYA